MNYDCQANTFVREAQRRLYDEALSEIASFLSVSSENLVFCQNGTAGINTILKSLPRVLHRASSPKRLDPIRILCAATIYPAVYSTLKDLDFPVEIIQVERIVYPISDDDYVSAIQQKIQQRHARIDFAIFDWYTSVSFSLMCRHRITSAPGLLVPINRIIALCRSHGIIICVDAAHAAGQIPDICLETMDADFFVSCLHKWAYTPRGLSVLYAKTRYKSAIVPLVTAYFDGNSSWRDRHAYQGTTAGVVEACVPAALDFRRWCGGSRAIYTYCHELAWKGATLVAEMVNRIYG